MSELVCRLKNIAANSVHQSLCSQSALLERRFFELDVLLLLLLLLCSWRIFHGTAVLCPVRHILLPSLTKPHCLSPCLFGLCLPCFTGLGAYAGSGGGFHGDLQPPQRQRRHGHPQHGELQCSAE